MNFPANSIVRLLRVGGMTKGELLARLLDANIRLNDSARVLFADERFTTSSTVVSWETVELSVAALGFAEGAEIGRIRARAAACGLALCPLELAPHFRLQYLDQPEGGLGCPPTRHRAPTGSITVMSPELSRSDEVPKGFYLRRIEGALWLRGYCSGAEHVWSAEDRLVFCRA